MSKNQRALAVRLPEYLEPMLRRWLRDHTGKEYQEPRPFVVDEGANTISWLDQAERDRIALSAHPLFNHGSGRSILPAAAMNDSQKAMLRELASQAAPQPTPEQVRRLATTGVFNNLAAYRLARKPRDGSEVDFGANHRAWDEHDPEQRLNTWTVSVVESTGDVYAWCRRTNTVLVLGSVQANDGCADAGQRFRGWQEVMPGRSISWFQGRCWEADPQ